MFSMVTLMWISVCSEEEVPGTPIITITEDHSLPADEDDFVKYFGLESYTEGILGCYCNVVCSRFSTSPPCVDVKLDLLCVCFIQHLALSPNVPLKNLCKLYV